MTCLTPTIASPVLSLANCTSCGNYIPEGQGKSCSMCYGEIDTLLDIKSVDDLENIGEAKHIASHCADDLY